MNTTNFWGDYQFALNAGSRYFNANSNWTILNGSFKCLRPNVPPELQEYCKMITGAVNYVNQTFSLFKQAAEVRPSQLLVKKEKR